MLKNKRNVITRAICAVCGRENESTFHALLACPVAPALWDAMQEIWPITRRVDVQWSGDEWLFNLLDGQLDQYRDMIIMVL